MSSSDTVRCRLAGPSPIGEIHILDNGAEAQAGDEGEIVIAGPNVSAGYIHRPDLTERAFYRIK